MAACAQESITETELEDEPRFEGMSWLGPVADGCRGPFGPSVAPRCKRTECSRRLDGPLSTLDANSDDAHQQQE